MSDQNQPGCPPAPGLFSSPKLFARIRTALVLGVTAILVVLCTLNWPLYLLMAAIGLQGTVELRRILGNPPLAALAPLVLGLVVLILNIQPWVPVPLSSLTILGLGTAALAVRSLQGKPGPFDGLAVGWLAAPIACGLWLHDVSLDPTRLFSPNLLFLVLLPLWFGDTAAYFIGKKFGRTPLAPTVSPNKTWEGAIANFLASVIVAAAVGAFFHLALPVSLAVGVVIGIVGQLGDLLQSQLKRSASLKDSGALLPGHGGVLDRLDSFLLSSVPAATILWILAPYLFHVKQ